jgi:hypothetical protein
MTGLDMLEPPLFLPRKLIQKRRKHVFRDVPFELFHRAEMFPAERAASDDNLVLLVHECR